MGTQPSRLGEHWDPDKEDPCYLFLVGGGGGLFGRMPHTNLQRIRAAIEPPNRASLALVFEQDQL